MKQLKEKGKWLFKESCEDQEKAYFGTDTPPKTNIKNKYYKSRCYLTNSDTNVRK